MDPEEAPPGDPLISGGGLRMSVEAEDPPPKLLAPEIDLRVPIGSCRLVGAEHPPPVLIDGLHLDIKRLLPSEGGNSMEGSELVSCKLSKELECVRLLELLLRLGCVWRRVKSISSSRLRLRLKAEGFAPGSEIPELARKGM